MEDLIIYVDLYLNDSRPPSIRLTMLLNIVGFVRKPSFSIYP